MEISNYRIKSCKDRVELRICHTLHNHMPIFEFYILRLRLRVQCVGILSFLTSEELKYIVEPPSALKLALRTPSCVRYVDVHTELTERGRQAGAPNTGRLVNTKMPDEMTSKKKTHVMDCSRRRPRVRLEL